MCPLKLNWAYVIFSKDRPKKTDDNTDLGMYSVVYSSAKDTTHFRKHT